MLTLVPSMAPSNITLALPAGMSRREHSLAMHSKFLDSLSTFVPKPSTLNFLHHNAHSFLPKLGHYTSLPAIQNYDFISISQSWLHPQLPSQMATVPNFKIVQGDRMSSDKTQGGGALLLVKSYLNVLPIDHIFSLIPSGDSVWVKLTFSDRSPV